MRLSYNAHPCLFAWKNHSQNPLEILHGIDSVGNFCGHDQHLSGVDDMPHTAHREFSDALQHVDKSVTSGVMGADFLSLGKSEQGHADRAVLRERLADHLSSMGL